MSTSKESLSSSALVSHVEPLLLSATTLGRLFAAKSVSASNSSVSELSPVDGDFRFAAGSAFLGAEFPLFLLCSYSKSGGPQV